MKILLVHPGASWSTVDVYQGLSYGLQQHGIQLIHYRLGQRIEAAHKSLFALWRVKKKEDAGTPKPSPADMMYLAGMGALEMALREQVDVVVIVSAMYLHPDVIVLMKRAGLRVTVLFTETPYDLDHELKIAALVDGCWTTERASLPAFRAVNPRSGYLPHGWHPLRHYVAHPVPMAVEDGRGPRAHDVVFVGTGFPERVSFFNAIDWTGIDLGIYGHWNEKTCPLKPDLRAAVHEGPVENAHAAALYRRAKIGLNLYRVWAGWGQDRHRVVGDSLSPRAYELAACGVFHLSSYRAEVVETFGDLVPTFRTPTEAAALIRLWLADRQGRARVAASLPACVAEASWTERSQIVMGDLHALLQTRPASSGRWDSPWLSTPDATASSISPPQAPATRQACSA